jgi:hypothetical protein
MVEPGMVPGVDPYVQHQLSQKPDDELHPVARYIQMFEDVQYPWDPAVIKAIRLFDPRVVPLCSVSVYRHPNGGTEKYVRHAIALEVYPLEFREPVMTNLLAPSYPGSVNYGRRPNVWLKGWAGPQPDTVVTPGEYWPFDWECLRFLKERFATYDSNATKVIKTMVDAEEEAKQKALDAEDRESSYRLDHDWVNLQNAARRVDPSLIKRGVMVDTTPNPFVYLGS